MAQDVGDVLIFFLCELSLVGAVVEALVGCGSFLWIGPEVVVRGVFGEEVAGDDTVHGRVLDVDVQVGALHCDDDVEIEL